jgi:hypothetical protein
VPITKFTLKEGQQMMAWAVDSKTMGDTAYNVKEVRILRIM